MSDPALQCPGDRAGQAKTLGLGQPPLQRRSQTNVWNHR